MIKNILVLILLCAKVSISQTINGSIKDKRTNEPLVGAMVMVKGSSKGSVTDSEGKFSFDAPAPPFVLVVSSIGYVKTEITVNSLDKPITVKIESDDITTEDVEIVDTRITEKQKESPLTVETLDAIAIKATSAANFYEGLGQLKGVDLTSASIGFRIINTRGFNSTSPVRSLQIIDGVDNQAPGLNFSLGNFLGSSELDVQKAEIIVGASSAYYGPNAFNGVISMNTKNPFLKQGVSASIKVGERNLLDVAVRYAEAFKNKNGVEKFAFKINASYMHANDWQANNMDPTTQSVDGKDNWGGYDAVNRYGDEVVYYANTNGDRRNVPGLRNFYRTGYKESDLVDYNTKNIKLGTALHYRVKPETELIYAFNFGTGTTVYQGDNRYSLKDILFFQNRLELVKKDKYFIRAYATNENAGNSYDAVFTALLLQNSVKTDAEWGNKDYRNYWSANVVSQVKALPGFPSIGSFPVFNPNYNEEADAVLSANSIQLQAWHDDARYYADNSGGKNFLVPGTDAFKAAFNDVISKPLNQGGSKFIDKSALYHAHGEYKFTPKFMNITTGGNVRLYTPNSKGTIFSDTGNVVITNYEFGAYIGLEKKIWNDKIKLNATTRLDKNKNFNFIISPAGSVVYTINKNNILRLSFSSAIRNPTLQDQYLYYNVGRAILLGNLNGYDSLVTIESIKDYYSGIYVDRSKLSYFSIDKVKPEKVKSLEIGYRTTVFKNLFIDGSAYYSIYKDFLGYKIGADVNFNPSSPNDISAIAFYRIASNATSIVTTQGASIGATYYFKKFFSLTGNYSRNEILKQDKNDAIIPAFNTPKDKFNVGINGRDIKFKIRTTAKSDETQKYISLNDFGFSINYKWVAGYYFEGSPQFTGTVPEYDMLDAQISKFVPKIKTTFKLGASNILNNQKFQVYGGPRIGRMAYFSVLLELDKF